MRKVALPFTLLVFTSTLFLATCNVLQVFQKPNDKAITSEIQAELFQDPSLKSQDIHVVSEKGVVVLSGSVNTDQAKTAAEQVANRVPGVKQVINQIAVSTAQAPPVSPEMAIQPAPEQAPLKAARNPEPFSSTRRSKAVEPSPMAAAAVTQPVRAVAPPNPAEKAAFNTPAAPRQPEQVTIPAGTVITVRLIDSVDTSRNHSGEEFAATVDHPIVADDRVVIPQYADARVRLVEARSAGHMTGRSDLVLELVRVTIGGNSYQVETGAYRQEGASRGKRTAETVGGGAGVGALIGAIAGKGKGAAIGAAVGAAAGTAVQAGTQGQQVKIPAETKLDFTLKTPLSVAL